MADLAPPEKGDVEQWVLAITDLFNRTNLQNGQLTQVLAFLAALDPEWTAAAAPHPLHSLNAIDLTTSDDQAYVATPGEPWTAYADSVWQILRFPSAPTGNVTLNFSGLGPKNLFINGTQLGAAGVAANDLVMVGFDTTNDRFDMVRGFFAGASSIINVEADYTVTLANVAGGECKVIVDTEDGTPGDRAIDAPSVEDLKDKLLWVFVGTDPTGTDGRMVQLFQSDGATELWRGYVQGDWALLTSDGSAYELLTNRTVMRTHMRLNADESVSAGTTKKVYDASTDIEKNIGGGWQTDTHRYEPPLTGWYRIRMMHLYDDSSNYQIQMLYKDGSAWKDIHDADSDEDSTSPSPYVGAPGNYFYLEAGHHYEIYVKNFHGSTTYTLRGNGTDEESHVIIEYLGEAA